MHAYFNERKDIISSISSLAFRQRRRRQRHAKNRYLDMDDDDDGFQVNTTTVTNKESNVRLYLGGLPSTSISSSSTIINEEDSIRSWLKERLPNNVEIIDVEIKQGTNANNTYALVEWDSIKYDSDSSPTISINDVIWELKNKPDNNNCDYNGCKITIQREQRRQNNDNTNNKTKKKTTSKKNVMRRGATGRKTRGGKYNGGPSLTSKGWSKPSSTVVVTPIVSSIVVPSASVESKKTVVQKKMEDIKSESNNNDDPVLQSSTLDAASEQIASVVSNEFGKVVSTTTNNNRDDDDAINTALASTAATTMVVSSMLLSSLAFGDVAETTTTETETPFFNPKGTAMTDLLSEFGAADPDWKKKIVNVTKTDHVADLVAQDKVDKDTAEVVEDGDDDDDDDDNDNDNEEEEVADEDDADNEDSNTKTDTKTTKIINISKLAIKGKAPIHISIESFGYVHGVPSRRNQEKSGSPYTQPCPVIYIDDTITDPVPHYLAFHDGLRSGVIKRLMKHALLNKKNNEDKYDNKYDTDDDDVHVDLTQYTNFHDYCKKYITEQLIWKTLLEAIEIGGHGYVSPITMNFQIGSELGRHRSVIAVEWIAVHLRSLLRKNITNARIGTNCSVSVGTIHRDIKKKIPNKKYKEDDDDYYDKNDHV